MTTRVQLELSEDRVERLKEIMKLCEITTQKELFNNSLALFEWAVKQRQSGRMIASVDENNMRFKEISMPALEAVAVVQAPKTETATGYGR